MVTHNGAKFIQGGEGAGTGQFDPFLTLQAVNADDSSNEQGYNTTDANAEFDTFTGADRTSPLNAAAVPAQLYEGTLYREFSLDANDTGSDDFMTVDAWKLFLDDQNNLTDYDIATGTFGSDNVTAAYLIYDMGAGGDTTLLMRSQTLTPGSGVSDITVLVPDSLFPADCYYGSTTCNLWIYLYTESGFYDDDGTGTDGVAGTQNWDVTGGFEEWRTRLLPVVNIAKTVSLSRTCTYDWTLVKEISIDGGTTWHDSRTVDLFTGQSQSYLWKLTWTKGTCQPGALTVNGTITITNPTGGTNVIGTGIPAVINSVTDVLNLGGAVTTSVNCGQTFPYTLAAGGTLNCTYTAIGALTQTDGTNRVDVALDMGTALDITYSSPTIPVLWANATTAEVDETASINDPTVPGLNQTGLTGSGSFTSSAQSFTCGVDTTITNTATLTEGDSGQTRIDSASLTVDCHGLTVGKTVTTTFTRSYDWTLVKEISIDGGSTWFDSRTVDLFTGQSQSYLWKLTWTRNAGTDSAWTVSGTITVTNNAPIAATGVVVTDALSVSGAATVVCPGDTNTGNVPASGGTLVCTYSKAIGAATNQTNTATATLSGTGYNSAAEAVTFSSTPTTEVDETASIDDPSVPGLNQTGLTSGSSATSSTQSYLCGVDTTITNTATLTEGDNGTTRIDSASLTVDCHGLTVGKTANTTFTRTYHWAIDKDSTDPATLTLNPGNTYSYPYRVRVQLAATPYTDSAWAVSGTITITNASPIAATGVSVTDLLSIDGAATVDCNSDPAIVSTTVNVPANGTATCTYTKSLASAASQTNTATATFAGTPYSSSAVPVTFSSTPTTQIDECITVTDSLQGTLGTACVGETLPKTFSYNRTIGPYTEAQCGTQTVNNTATFTTYDTSTTGTDSWIVTITIPCPTGCTLTQGYWKTHSSYGPAPTDLNWTTPTNSDPLNQFNQDTTFFLSGDTYYEVMWTAPKGGNPYYILAHQYIAAKLNIRAGAATTAAVDAAIAYAETFFATYTPTSTFTKAVRTEAIAAAGTLASYNEGDIGPGHCSEDSIARSASE